MGITFAIANLKHARDLKRTIETLDTALLYIKLVKSFVIAILDALIDCKFPSPLSTTNYTLIASPVQRITCVHNQPPIIILQPPNKLLKNHRWHAAHCQSSMMSYFQRRGQSSTLAIWLTSLCSAYYYPIKRMHLITRFYSTTPTENILEIYQKPLSQGHFTIMDTMFVSDGVLSRGIHCNLCTDAA